MQEVWESYMKPIDGHPAVVAFNAEVAEGLPDDELGVMGFVKIMLNDPTSEGLVSQSEADDIGFVEDRLEMEALRYRIGKYVGRIMTNGEVNFLFYLKYAFEWRDVAANAMENFSQFKYEYGSRVDEEWEVYRKLLFPTPREWQLIHNHHACDRLKAAGDNLRLPRAIEHRSFFETSEGRARFADAITADGFCVQKELQPTGDTLFYGLQFYRIDTPYYYDIDTLALALIDLGEAFGGQYDGWETSLVKM